MNSHRASLCKLPCRWKIVMNGDQADLPRGWNQLYNLYIWWFPWPWGYPITLVALYWTSREKEWWLGVALWLRKPPCIHTHVFDQRNTTDISSKQMNYNMSGKTVHEYQYEWRYQHIRIYRISLNQLTFLIQHVNTSVSDNRWLPQNLHFMILVESGGLWL